jgi:hypothetical protein
VRSGLLELAGLVPDGELGDETLAAELRSGLGDLRGRCLVSPALAVYRLEDGEWKIAHRHRDDNIWLDQARQ